MTVQVVQGDISEISEGIIAHQVNCQGVMGSGVALALRNKFPEIYMPYRSMCVAYRKEPSILLGTAQPVFIKSNLYVYNLFGQENYGRSGKKYTDLDALELAFAELDKASKRLGMRVYLPWGIGCGRGGASWENEVWALLSDYDFTLVKYDK